MIEHAVSDRQAATRQQPSPSTVALPVSAADALNWDVVIETPPPRASGTIHTSLIHAGRSQPNLVTADDSNTNP